MKFTPDLTNSGKGMLIAALSGSHLNFTKIKVGDGSAPSEPKSGNLWYDTQNNILYEFDVCWNTSSQTVTVTDVEPTEPKCGDLWYSITSKILYRYSYGWIENATEIVRSASAPESPEIGDYWFDTNTYLLNQYDGTQWKQIEEKSFVYSDVEPRGAIEGDWWLNTASGLLYEYGLFWSQDAAVYFTYGEEAPSTANESDLWYDTADSILKEYLSGWNPVENKKFSYSNVQPETAVEGDLWFYLQTETLYEYIGGEWEINLETIICSDLKPEVKEALTDLVNPLIEASIKEIKRGPNFVSLTCMFDNSTIKGGFKWRETGVYATNVNGEELLYAYCNVGDDYTSIPSNDSGRVVEFKFTLLVVVDDAEQISATIGEGMVYVSKESFEDHIKDYNNPHKVTPDLIGLGNVENVAPPDMAIRYDIAEKLEENESGEKMKITLGKVKRAINTLINHIKANNPHSITASKIKAADANHTHFSIGTYTGDGENVRKITLPFTPSAVFVTNNKAQFGDIEGTYGGFATKTEDALASATGNTVLSITSIGFYVYQQPLASRQTNKKGQIYHYIAFK